MEKPKEVLAGKRAAKRFGEPHSSSFNRPQGTWAFEILSGGRTLVLAGGASVKRRVILIVEREHVFAALEHAQALVRPSLGPPHSIEQLQRRTLIFAGNWECRSFYLSRDRVSGMRKRGDVLAVALHSQELGENVDATEALVRDRTPGLVSSPDPLANHPEFPTWLKVLNRLRRLTKLRALNAPQVILDHETRLAKEAWGSGTLSPVVVTWPSDLRSVASELGFVVPRREPSSPDRDLSSVELTKLALCFVPTALSLDATILHLRSRAELSALPFKSTSSGISLVERGYELRVTHTTKTSEVKRLARLPGRRLEELERCEMVLAIECRVSPEYESTQYSAGAVTVPWQALAVCETLAALPGAVVYDVSRGAFYDGG